MHRLLAPVVVLILSPVVPAADPEKLTLESADARLRSAFALARETNDRALVNRVLELRDDVRRALGRMDVVAAERLIRDAEEAVGLEAGGQAMFGLPVARPTPGVQQQIDALQQRMAESMQQGDAAAVTARVAEAIKLLGEQAGVPDARRKGDLGNSVPVKPADVADVLVKAVQANPRSLQVLSAGVPGSEMLPRAYASVVLGCVAIRPLVAEHQRDKVELIDGLVAGCCKAMTTLQLEAGFFRFPDLRDRHLRFGAMIEKLVEKDPDAIREGWLVVADPEGGSQFDAGECGIALLRAGAAYKNPDWTRAGLRAADWALSVPSVPNFNYNAFSISLLCEAFRTAGEIKYLDGALGKYRVGLAPGQSATGRWVDGHNARTVYHVIILRALHDLIEVLPAGKEREAITQSARRAVEALLAEAKSLGAPSTSHTVQELERHRRLTGDTPAPLSAVLEQAATAAFQKCIRGGKVTAAVPLPELAAVARVWEHKE